MFQHLQLGGHMVAPFVGQTPDQIHAFFPSKTSRRTVGMLTLLTLSAVFARSAEAGFFEDLFGADEAPVARGARGGHSWAGRGSRIEHARRAGARHTSARPKFARANLAERHAVPAAHTQGPWAARVAAPWTGSTQAAWTVSTPTPTAVASAPGSVKPKRARFCGDDDQATKILDYKEALVRDPTLRYGDVIVTDEGVRIFEGSWVCPHTISDFRTLAEVRDLNVGTRAVLAEIERTLKARNVGRIDQAVVASDPNEH